MKDEKVVSLVPTTPTTNVSTNITINGNTKTNTSTSTSAKGSTSWKTVHVINFSKGKPTWKYWKLFKMNIPRLRLHLVEVLRKYYKKMTVTPDYIYAEGDIPIMLVAHMDTVHKKIPRVEQDYKKGVLWSTTGLGGDDRAGIAGILEILNRGLRPHVLFTDEEECGGVGARKAAVQLNPEVNFIIELDRRGKNDAVYYDDDNTEFHEYIESYGFEYAYGSFSDISYLCPIWGTSGVNLSIGYYNAHTASEYVRISEWEDTVNKVEKILRAPTTKKFEYVKKSYSYSKFSFYDDDDYNYRYGYGGGYTSEYASSVDDYVSEGISVGVGNLEIFVPIFELADEIGGTYAEWAQFLENNAYELDKRIHEAVFDEIYQYCIEKMPDFLL
jgi:hypothetical protein